MVKATNIYHGRRVGRWIRFAGPILLVLSSVGCATVEPAKTPLELASLPESKLNLGPGDVLDIKFFFNPELNETQTVGPDGKIALQLIDEVMVQGKTRAELRRELIQLYHAGRWFRLQAGGSKQCGNHPAQGRQAVRVRP